MRKNAEDILNRNQDLYEKYVQNNYKLDIVDDPRITLLADYCENGHWMNFPSYSMF